jgi:hypothetical protein
MNTKKQVLSWEPVPKDEIAFYFKNPEVKRDSFKFIENKTQVVEFEIAFKKDRNKNWFWGVYINGKQILIYGTSQVDSLEIFKVINGSKIDAENLVKKIIEKRTLSYKIKKIKKTWRTPVKKN